jgi:tRNA G18 (ribose-2'-O)-methylase SpoU
MNVIDSLKNYSIPDIKEYCCSRTICSSVAMVNIGGDFNFSTMVRNANFFGFRNVYHIAPKKKWDKRGSVGTYHYTPIHHYNNFDSFFEEMHKQNCRTVAIENNIPEFEDKTINLYSYNQYVENTVFIFGEENSGLDSQILQQVDSIITIQGYGSVRSLNVGTASGIVMGWQRYLMENS